jgi:hypothetical protein
MKTRIFLLFVGLLFFQYKAISQDTLRILLREFKSKMLNESAVNELKSMHGAEFLRKARPRLIGGEISENLKIVFQDTEKRMSRMLPKV